MKVAKEGTLTLYVRYSILGASLSLLVLDLFEGEFSLTLPSLNRFLEVVATEDSLVSCKSNELIKCSR